MHSQILGELWCITTVALLVASVLIAQAPLLPWPVPARVIPPPGIILTSMALVGRLHLRVDHSVRLVSEPARDGAWTQPMRCGTNERLLPIHRDDERPKAVGCG